MPDAINVLLYFVVVTVFCSCYAVISAVSQASVNMQMICPLIIVTPHNTQSVSFQIIKLF